MNTVILRISSGMNIHSEIDKDKFEKDLLKVESDLTFNWIGWLVEVSSINNINNLQNDLKYFSTEPIDFIQYNEIEATNNIENHDHIYSKYLGYEVDRMILPLIEKINKAGCETYQSCQGRDETNEYHKELAWVILSKKDFHKVEHFFSDFKKRDEAEDYLLREYCNNPPLNKDVLFIQFDLERNLL